MGSLLNVHFSIPLFPWALARTIIIVNKENVSVYYVLIMGNRNQTLQTSKMPFKRQGQGISLFTSAEQDGRAVTDCIVFGIISCLQIQNPGR